MIVSEAPNQKEKASMRSPFTLWFFIIHSALKVLGAVNPAFTYHAEINTFHQPRLFAG